MNDNNLRHRELIVLLNAKEGDLSVEDLYNLGYSHYNLSNFEIAKEYFERLNQLKTFVGVEKEILPSIDYFLDAIKKNEQSKFNSTFFNFTAGCANSYVRLGAMDSVLEQGNLLMTKTAIYYFNRAIDLDTENIEAYKLRADAFVVMGFYNDAREDYNTAVEKSLAQNSDKYLKKAQIVIEMMNAIDGDISKTALYEESKKIFEKYETYPEFIDNDGFKRLKSMELDARKDNGIETMIEKCEMYMELGEWDSAIEMADCILKKEPKNARAKELKEDASYLKEEIGH